MFCDERVFPSVGRIEELLGVLGLYVMEAGWGEDVS